MAKQHDQQTRGERYAFLTIASPSCRHEPHSSPYTSQALMVSAMVLVRLTLGVAALVAERVASTVESPRIA